MLDVCIRNGLVVDGTGSPAFRGDVGVRAGRVVAVGEVTEQAAKEIDAEGLLVTPGFVDVHTHYDAQLMWDPAATPSSLNGVTSVFGGNCGFTIAPFAEDAADYVLPMLARVEGMPLAALEAALDLKWSSFGSWLDRLEGNLAVNAGFLVGHSTLRRVVLGDAAVERAATPDELARLVALLEQSIVEGALGFSSTRSMAHVDHNGDLVPSHASSDEEMIELSAAVGRHPGTVLEFIPTVEPFFDHHDIELMARMSGAARRSLNWNLLRVRPAEDDSRSNRLGADARAAELGGRIVALMLPQPWDQRLTMESGFVYETLPGWASFMGLPVDGRIAALRDDPDLLRRLEADAATAPDRLWRRWPDQLISDVSTPELQPLVGRRIGEIAAERGVSAFEALFDIQVADRFRTGLLQPRIDDDDDCWGERIRLAGDTRRVLIGGSDAGAHIDMMKTFGCYANFLAVAVRQRRLTSWEQAVHWITAAPTDLYGVVDRGRLVPGAWADVNVFDPDAIDAGRVQIRNDLPGGAARLYGEAVGIHHTLVNGVEIATDGALTGELPGSVVRSGTHTTTVDTRS